MNKMFQLTAAALLVSGMSLSLPLSADTTPPEIMGKKPITTADSPAGMPNDSADSSKTEASPSLKKTLRFTLQHRFNGGEPLPKETIEVPYKTFGDNPRAFFGAFIQNFSKHLEKQKKPLQIDTVLEWLPAQEIVGKLPTYSIKTQVNSDGTGKSNWVMPAYQLEMTEGEVKFLINSKASNGQYTFSDKFESITGQMNMLGFTMSVPGQFSMSWGESTFGGVFDAEFRPSQMEAKISLIEISTPGRFQANLPDVTFNLNLDKTSKGLERRNYSFKAGQIDLTGGDFKANLDKFVATLSSEEQDGVVNYSLQTQTDKFSLKDNTPSGGFDLNEYVGHFAVRRLDAQALSALQTTMNKLDQEDPEAFMGLLGKFIEVVPQLVAKSPEIALTQLTLKTPTGNLDGNATVMLNGKKVTSLELAVLISALQAQANFVIGKHWLKQMLTRSIGNEMQAQFEFYTGSKANEAVLAELQRQAESTSEQQIAMYVALRLLIEAGDNYKLAAEFKDGKLIVNGQEIPLPPVDAP
jgi:uncharacterized protein YdgA (DUF945 family)